jgi:hypothetical protein
MVIVVDQFEEFFIFWPEPGQRKPFIDALADCYDDKMLPLRIIVALRKDYYSDLADLEGRIGTIFHNQYRLDQMTRDEALAAITGPVTKLGRPVTYEQDLLDTLLDDLARGGMELPYLQIICTRLYEVLAPSEQTISTDAYERLGRAEGVLGIYLAEVLERLPGKGPDIAKSVLRELVTAEATKRVLSYKALEARLGADADELDSVLRRLVNARLLRRAEVADEVLYELAHECLIEEINKWIDVSDLELKLAEELMVREVESWRTHRTLIPEARLEMLYPYRDRFRGMDDEAWNCILYSALEIDRGVEGWLQAADERGVRLLVAIMRDEGPSFLEAPGVRPRDPEQHWFDADAIRMRAEVLGPVKDSHSAHRPIVDLGKGKTRVRGLAAMALGQVGEAAVDSLIDALSDKEWRVRRAAAESLGRIGDPRAVEPLVATLRFEDVDVRSAAVTALIRIGEPAVTALKDALRSEVPGVRRSAVKALRGIGTSRALSMLEEEKD